MLEGHALWSLTDLHGSPDKRDLFKCPDCDEDFTKLSGLLMHAESPACEQALNDGAIVKVGKWLANRHT